MVKPSEDADRFAAFVAGCEADAHRLNERFDEARKSADRLIAQCEGAKRGFIELLASRNHTLNAEQKAEAQWALGEADRVISRTKERQRENERRQQHSAAFTAAVREVFGGAIPPSGRASVDDGGTSAPMHELGHPTDDDPRRAFDEAARAAGVRQTRLVDGRGIVHERDYLTGQWKPRLGPGGYVERDVARFTGEPNIPRTPFSQPARERFTGRLIEGPDGGPLYRR